MKWISIKEKLPVNNIKIIVYGKWFIDGGMQTIWDAEPSTNDINGWINDYNITHWMPFTELPKIKTD